MSSDFSSPRHVTEYEFDSENRLCEVREVSGADGSVEFTHGWSPELASPSFAFEHDQQERLFVLIRADGKTEYLWDNPAGPDGDA